MRLSSEKGESVLRRAFALRFAAALLAALPLAEAAALGANGALLGSIASVAEFVLAIAIVLLLRADLTVLRSGWPIIALLFAALIWLALPIVVPSLVRTAFAPDLRLDGFVRVAAGLAVLLAAALVGYRRGLMRLALDWLILFGVFQIVLGLILRTIDPSHVWGYPHSITAARFSGTMINANANACFSAVTGLLGFARSQTLLRVEAADSLTGALVRVGCALGTVLALGACIVAGSRMTVVMLVIAIATLSLRHSEFRSFLLRPAGGAATAGAAFVVLMMFLLVDDTVLQRFATLGADSVDRIAIWRHYGAIAMSAPEFGYGPAAFSEMNAASLKIPSEAFSFWYVNAAHNELIQLVIDGGLAYAIILTSALAGMFVVALRFGRRHARDPMVDAAVAAMAVIGGAASVDIALDVPAVTSLAAVLLGMLWGRGLRAEASAQRQKTAGT